MPFADVGDAAGPVDELGGRLVVVVLEAGGGPIAREQARVEHADEVLEVWTSSHIDTIVRGKAEQPNTEDPSVEHRGLGWSWADADALVQELIYGLVERSDGGTVGELLPPGKILGSLP